MKKTILKKRFIAFILIALAGWLLTPIYSFYAHKDKLPMPAWGWLEIPRQSHSTVNLYNQLFEEAGRLSSKALHKHKDNISSPAISAAVVLDNQLVWEAAIGWEDIETNKPISINSRFRIGSTSKAITALITARLVDQNKIDLDTSINHYIPNLPNNKWQNITPRMLLSHTSGLPHYKSNTDYLGLYKTISLQSNYDTMTEALDVFDTSELLFEPGTAFHYSTLGTVLLGAVIESVTDKPFFESAQDLLLNPLKLSSTIKAPANSKQGKNIANSYKNNKQNNTVRVWREVNLSHRLPGGGFASTSSELAIIGNAFMDPTFINSNTFRQFTQPQFVNGEKNPQNYALGWRVTNYEIGKHGKITIVNHGGVSRGAQSWLMILPEYKMSIAVNINTTTTHFWDFAEVSIKIADYFIQAWLDSKTLSR